MNSRPIRSLLVGFLLVSVVSPTGLNCAPREQAVSSKLRIATTTSLYDSGMWDRLEPIFEAKYGIDMEVLYAGTGVAVRYGENGDVDAIVVHDPDKEERFVSQGYGVERVPFAYSYFLIVGPRGDPVGIKDLAPEEAFARLAASGVAPFVSRGDESGTHAREKEIWSRAGFDYEVVRKGRWYMESGRGMGPTLLIASEKFGYTLTDRATFLVYKGKLDLVPLVDKGEALLNVYTIIAVSPAKFPTVNYAAAKRLVEFLVSEEVRDFLEHYGTEDYGEPLFFPYDRQ